MTADPMMIATQSTKELERGGPPLRPASDLTLRLDQTWRILNLNQDLIRAADQKIYLLIVMSTLLVSYVATNIEKIGKIGALQYGLLAVFILVSGTFYFFALSTLFPRKSKAPTKENASLIFFGDIATRPNAESYINDMGSIALQQLYDDLARQIYLVSQVATSKYLAYRRAWRAILVEVSLFVVLAMSMAVSRA
jgi:hypothetical protein